MVNIKKIIKCVSLGLCIISASPVVTAAEQTEKLWSLITLGGNYGKIVYYIEPQLRLIYRKNEFQQFLTNTGVGYKFKPQWQIWLGQTFSADSQDSVPGSLDEYRFWQQIVWQHDLNLATFISRSRVEERKSLFFNEWAYRFRKRVLLNQPLNERYSLVINNEFFININKVNWIITDTFDQNRAYVGLERRINKIFYLGLGYMNQYLSTIIPQDNHILWLNWRIDLKDN